MFPLQIFPPGLEGTLLVPVLVGVVVMLILHDCWGWDFVGLVVPHVLRLAIGPDHRLLLPASVLYGISPAFVSRLGARIVASSRAFQAKPTQGSSGPA